ncbi:MAG TPA: carboxypeptidase-like regulatory domain-containing protein [Bryobacteraceae bacterium]|nr:carboxypeptidase-like regulatory domain-containing protein [Bryobacteraceae bacterium]
MRSLLLRRSAVLLLLLLAATPLLPQSSNGSVRGTVQDSSNAVIPGATVVLTNIATNIAQSTTTNDVGLYVFPAVAPGQYQAVVTSPGMQAYQAKLTVQVQHSHVVDATLTPGGTTTVISVTEVTPMITADSATLSHVLERERIEQLPINGRQITNLLWTVPGITLDLVETAIRTYGTRMGTHDMSLDGAPLTDAVGGINSVARQPSLESIQEFSVQHNSVSAKNARQTNIVLTTRSGTNQFHGSLFETNRNNSIGIARTRENNTNTAAHYVRNEFGGSAGGPVFIPKLYNGKDRTFWFFSYEGFREHQASVGGFRVPTEAMRQGDFSGLVDGAGTRPKLYNPFQTDPVTKLRPQFMYNGVANVIDPALMSPLWKYFADVLPLPNTPGANPLVQANYWGPRPDLLDQWTYSMKFDHNVNERNHVSVRLTNSMSERFRETNGVPTSDHLGNSRYDVAPNKSIALNWGSSHSATFFTETVLSATRSLASTASGDPGVMYANQLGLPNPNAQVGFPVINNIGFGAGNPGPNYFFPQSARAQFFNYFVLDENATKIVGRHEFEVGGRLRYNQFTYMPQQQRAAGGISFPTIATAQWDSTVLDRSRAVANTGHIAASAFLGLANYDYRVVKQKYYIRAHEDALYFQDRFKATQRLTLTLGVRWQASPFPKDKYDIFSSFDKKSMSVVLGNSLDTFYKVGATTPQLLSILSNYGAKFIQPEDAGLPKRLVNDQWLDFSPHLGFAYRGLEGRKSFILRGGFSTSYFPVPIYGWNDRMRLNAPFTGIYQNFGLTEATQSPDGQINYGLVSVPTIIAGKNSTNAVSMTNPTSIAPGSESFQAAYFDPNQPTSRVHDWNLTLEKEVASNMVMRVAYVGNRATHQDSYDNLNEMIPNYVWYMTKQEKLPTGTLANQLRRPYSEYPYGDLQEYRKDGWSNSNGAQFELERRYSKGVGFQVFYTLINVAKAGGHGWQSDSLVSPTSSYLPGAVPEDRTERMKLLLYARDISVPKHEVRWNWIADLPFGKGKPLGRNANSFVNAIIGGWQVSGMGRLRSNYTMLPTDIWPTGENVEFYGHDVPIEDCRGGACRPGYLMWNGYIPAHQINTPNGIMGVPDDYKPAAAPLTPYPADYLSRNANNDPNYPYYGTNTIKVKLKDGTTRETGFGALHPWINQPLASTRIWTTDAGLFKAFSIREGMKLRVQVDFLNLFNTPGNEYSTGSDGLALTNYSKNAPRMTQLSARFSW